MNAKIIPQRACLSMQVCALVALLFGMRGVQAAEPWPYVALPPRGEAQWVAQDMRVNGVPTRILQFQSRASRSEVVEYYRSYWTGGYPHSPSPHPLDDATVMSQMHGPYLMTVKVMDAKGGGSRGVIALAQVVGFKEDHDPGPIPLLNGSHVVSVVESQDPGKYSRQVVIVSPQPPSSVLRFYEESFVNAGWQPIQANALARSASRAAASFLVFSRGDSEIQISAVESADRRSTTLLANTVTKDTGAELNRGAD